MAWFSMAKLGLQCTTAVPFCSGRLRKFFTLRTSKEAQYMLQALVYPSNLHAMGIRVPFTRDLEVGQPFPIGYGQFNIHF